jgi:hypothetical protein
MAAPVMEIIYQCSQFINVGRPFHLGACLSTSAAVNMHSSYVFPLSCDFSDNLFLRPINVYLDRPVTVGRGKKYNIDETGNRKLP